MKNKLIIALFFTFTCFSISGEYNVDLSKKNNVIFISEAPIEDITGISDKIDGYLIGRTKDTVEGSELYFEIDLNSIDTGISLRNRHLRDNYLHTDKYPLAAFTGKIIGAEKRGNFWHVTVEGEMDIHGKSKSLKIEGVLSPFGDGFRVQSKYFIKLSDYGIPIPSLMVKKINENIQIVLDFYIKKVD